MADEHLTTEETNLDPTQTEKSGTGGQSSSATSPNDETKDASLDAEALEGASLLADAEVDKLAADADADDAAKDGGEDGADKDAAPTLIGAPEGDYDLSALMPEGVTIDKAALEAVTPLAKALNLSNDGLAKLAIEAQPIVAKQVMDNMVSNVVAVRTGWNADTLAAINGGETVDGVKMERDPIYQGKAVDAVRAQAARAMDRLAGDKLFPAAKEDGSPGTFRDFLKSTGLGNHPAMMQVMFLAGGLVDEDSDFVRVGDVPPSPKSREDKYYPKT